MILLKRSVARLRFSFFILHHLLFLFFILTTIQQQRINYHKLTLSIILILYLSTIYVVILD